MYSPLISSTLRSPAHHSESVLCLDDHVGDIHSAPYVSFTTSYSTKKEALPGAFPCGRPVPDSRTLTPRYPYTPSTPPSCSPPTPYSTLPREYPPSPSSPPGYATSLSRRNSVLQPIQLLSLPPSPYPSTTSILGPSATQTHSPLSYASPRFASSAAIFPKSLHATARNIVRQRSFSLLPSPELPEPVCCPPRLTLRRYARSNVRKTRAADPVIKWAAAIALMVLALLAAGCVVEYEKHWALGLGEHGRGVVVSWDGRAGMSLDSILHDL